MTKFERFKFNFIRRYGEREDIDRIFQLKNSVFKFIRKGAPIARLEIISARESICRTCPEWDSKALNYTGRCKKCGCSTWAKLRMASERCPLGKWEAHLTQPTN